MANIGTLKKINWMIVLVFLLIPCSAFANKTSITIEAPGEAALNSTVNIILHVSHKGNIFFHYTNWVSLKINDKEVQRWEFSAFNRPESGNFICEYTVTVSGPVKITAQGHCNIHGSAGIVEKTIAVE